MRKNYKSVFGPTKCGLILEDKIKLLRRLDAKRIRSIFVKWSAFANKLSEIKDSQFRDFVANCMIAQSKYSIENYLNIGTKDILLDNDIATRLNYCIKFSITKNLK